MIGDLLAAVFNLILVILYASVAVVVIVCGIGVLLFMLGWAVALVGAFLFFVMVLVGSL